MERKIFVAALLAAAAAVASPDSNVVAANSQCDASGTTAYAGGPLRVTWDWTWEWVPEGASKAIVSVSGEPVAGGVQKREFEAAGGVAETTFEDFLKESVPERRGEFELALEFADAEGVKARRVRRYLADPSAWEGIRVCVAPKDSGRWRGFAYASGPVVLPFDSEWESAPRRETRMTVLLRAAGSEGWSRTNAVAAARGWADLGRLPRGEYELRLLAGNAWGSFVAEATLEPVRGMVLIVR